MNNSFIWSKKMASVFGFVVFGICSVEEANARPADPAHVLTAVLKLPDFQEEMSWFANDEVNRIEIRQLKHDENLIFTDPRAYCAKEGGQSRSGTIIALIGWKDPYNRESRINQVRLFATSMNPEDVKLCSGLVIED